MKPRTSVVKVMPTWDADSCVESWPKEARTGLAAASPASLNRRLVKGYERELSDDEDSCPEGQRDAGKDQQPLRHSVPILRRRIRPVPPSGYRASWLPLVPGIQ